MLLFEGTLFLGRVKGTPHANHKFGVPLLELVESF